MGEGCAWSANKQRESAEKAQGDGRRLGNNINFHHAKGIERFLAVLETHIVDLEVRSAMAGAGIYPNPVPAVQVRIRLRAGSELQPGALVTLRVLEILVVCPELALSGDAGVGIMVRIVKHGSIGGDIDDVPLQRVFAGNQFIDAIQVGARPQAIRQGNENGRRWRGTVVGGPGVPVWAITRIRADGAPLEITVPTCKNELVRRDDLIVLGVLGTRGRGTCDEGQSGQQRWQPKALAPYSNSLPR